MTHAVFVVATAGLLIAADMQPPAARPPTAGERFKSVRVLADVPASLIIPTMAFISNSLGVTCLHCHTDVYESDEKPMKEKARAMIRMMRAVNETQFGGKRAVTCETCHHGRAIPESTPPIEDAAWNRPARVAEAPLPQAADVLERFQAAVGADALARLHSQRLTGTVTRNSGRTAPAGSAFALYQEKPRTIRLSTDLSHPPEADVELPMTFLRAAALQTTYPDLRVIGRERIGADAVIVATGTSARGVDRLYFSEASGLLVRRSDEIETPLGAVPERYDFGDFERVDGVMVPKTIVWSRADYQVTFAVREIRHEVSRQ
jgi:hypothetical protein